MPAVALLRAAVAARTTMLMRVGALAIAFLLAPGTALPASASDAMSSVLPIASAIPIDTVVPVLAVRLSDDDGKRAVSITPSQIATWIDEANRTWAAAGVRFAFDPERDVETLASSVLNGIGGPADRAWAAESTAANALAARNPGRLTLLFRYGPVLDPNPTAAGYAAPTADFIALPRFETKLCGAQDLGLFAHEVGHWLGVPNTYPRAYKNHGDADAWIRARLGSPAAFDGDGFNDTAADPFIADAANQCGTSPTLDVNGSVFTLPRTNIMSSYPTRRELSPMQVERARWVLALRVAHGLATPTNAGAIDALEIESLPVSGTHDAACATEELDPAVAGRWGAGKQLRCVVGDAGSVSVVLPALAAGGPYAITLYGGTAPDGAPFRVLLDDDPIGEAIDGHAPVALPTGPIALGSQALSAGKHTLTFEQTGTAAPSKGHALLLDAIRLVPLTLPLGLAGTPAPVRGGRIAITASTRPGARCTLSVPRAIAPSSGRGLPARVAPASGNVRWSWIVPRAAAAREYVATATCTLDPASGRATLRFTLRP